VGGRLLELERRLEACVWWAAGGGREVPLSLPVAAPGGSASAAPTRPDPTSWAAGMATRPLSRTGSRHHPATPSRPC